MKILRLLIIVTVMASSISLSGCDFSGGNDSDGKLVLNTSKGTHTYDVEVANDKESRELGLMHRTGLDDGKGMFFKYDEEILPAFWMKNMKFSLDIIFMDKNYKVVDFFTDVPPCKQDPCPHYIPETPSQYILEVNAGTSEEIGLQKGDIAEYK